MKATHIALFENTKPSKLFFTVAPMGAISMLASTLYVIVDAAIVGRYLGQTAFAAVNLVMPVIVIMNSVADLIGMGSAVPLAVALGKHDRGGADNVFTCASLGVVLSTAFCGWLLALLAPALIAAMGATGELASLAVQYVTVFAIAAPVTTIVFTVDNYLRVCGKATFSMMLNIIMAVTIMSLEWLFVGIFKWGIWAAPLGACIGMFACAVAAYIPFACGKFEIGFCKPRFTLALVKQIAACSFPNFLNNSAGRLIAIVLNCFLLRQGGEMAVAVYGILINMNEFIQSLLYGLNDSLQPAISYCWGAGRYDRVGAIVKWCFGVSALMSIVFGALIFAAPRWIISVFMGTMSVPLMDMAVPAVLIFGTMFLFRWISFATQSYALAIEKSKPVLALSMASVVIFPLVLVAILWPLGLTGFWLNMPVASLASAVLGIMLLKKINAEIKYLKERNNG